ncbi:hypothetical protein LSAT2_025807 [Lamellibrachia satsuma]|nr:hypothetical protein LSAT2_025807 [Lamellibrachia satsuma]
MRQAEYKEILSDNLLTQMTLLDCDTFVPDKAPCQAARPVTSWLESSFLAGRNLVFNPSKNALQIRQHATDTQTRTQLSNGTCACTVVEVLSAGITCVFTQQEEFSSVADGSRTANVSKIPR